MMKSSSFIELLKEKGFCHFSGVPCSVTKAMIAYLENDSTITYYPAPKEDLSFSWAAGVYLAGGNPFVMIQNSGLGNSIDVLFTLNQLYEIPGIFLVTWRGFEHNDEIQHWTWGDQQNELLKACDIPTITIGEDVNSSIDDAIKLRDKTQKPVALILKRRSYIDETA